MKKEGLMVVVYVPLFLAIFPEGLLSAQRPVDRSWCAQRAAATELRRKSLLRRSFADQLRHAHSARRAELLLLRRS